MKKYLFCILFVLNGLAYANTFNDTTPLNNPAVWQESTPMLWYQLQHTSLKTLETATIDPNDTLAMGWVKLAILSKHFSKNTPQLAHELEAWRTTYPQHPGNYLIPDNNTLNSLATPLFPKHIALLVPLQGAFSREGRAVRDGFLSAYYSATQKPALSIYDTNDKTPIAALYQKALAEGADYVIGPLTKDNVKDLTKHAKITVPTLALNYVETGWWGSTHNLFQFGLSPQDEVEQMVDKAHEAGYSHAIIIASDTEWGQRMAKIAAARWETVGGQIAENSFYNIKKNLTQQIADLLHVDPKLDRARMRKDNDKNRLAEQRRQDFDVIFLFATPDYARQIVPLLKYFYAGDIPVFATSSIYSGTPQPEKDTDLNGVMFDGIPWTLKHAEEHSGKQADPMYAVGHDAFLISQQMTRLMKLSQFSLYAATGALSLDSSQAIHRRLPWATMHDGRI